MVPLTHATVAKDGGGEVTIKPSDSEFFRRAEECNRRRPTLFDLEIWDFVSQQRSPVLAETLCRLFVVPERSITRANVFRTLQRMADVGLVEVVRDGHLIVSVQVCQE